VLQTTDLCETFGAYLEISCISFFKYVSVFSQYLPVTGWDMLFSTWSKTGKILRSSAVSQLLRQLCLSSYAAVSQFLRQLCLSCYVSCVSVVMSCSAVFRQSRTGTLGHRKPSLNHPNSIVFYSTRTPIPQPTSANQAGTSPNQHQLNSQSKPRKTSYRTRNHKKNLHHTLQARVISNSEGKNNHFRTDNWDSAALGIYYFTTRGQDHNTPTNSVLRISTTHPYLRTTTRFHSFSSEARSNLASPRSPHYHQTFKLWVFI
jgi:hypothetical protein